MPLPEPVLELATTVVPAAEQRGPLAFAYAHGAALAGFGDDNELGMVCVWDQEHVPDPAPAGARHLTQRDFDDLLEQLNIADDFSDPSALRLDEVAEFAYGVLLSDEDGAGAAARGRVWDFPANLVSGSAKVLSDDAQQLPGQLANARDPWDRADLLSAAVYRAYVAWFASHQRYFPGRAYRRDQIIDFGMDTEVCDLELRLWQAADATTVASNYRAFAERVLADC